jgi:hypothetical protein
MKTIETDLIVNQPGKAFFELDIPPNINIGKHHAVIVIEEQSVTVKGQKHSEKKEKTLPLQLSKYSVGLTDEKNSFRREDLYE